MVLNRCMPNNWKEKLPKLPKLPKSFRLPRQLKIPRSFPYRRIFTRKRVLIGCAVLLGFLIITPIATYAYYARDINDRTRLMNHNNTGIELKDKNGQVFYQYGWTSGDNEVPLNKISPAMQHAVVASEDKDFYNEGGISLRGMARAIYGDIINADPTKYGGSTITQQLVKNKLLTANKNFLRKYQEVTMAVAVSRHYSKDEILEMYLNSVYFGEGAFGVSDAAKTYFNTTPDKLDAAQSAMLVGLLPAPNAYSPLHGDKAMAVKEQKRVLKDMREQGYITAAEAHAAESEPLQYASSQPVTQFDHAQHFAQMVMDQLKQKYGDERIARSGFEVTTTLDLNMQKQAEADISRRVAQFSSGGGNNASLVAMDPKTGYVQALVGSVDWNNPQYGQVNMATMPRQPGSSFKPTYYTYALDKHMITPATLLEDKRITFGDWTPKDVDGYTGGPVTVRNALAQSMNVPAAEVMQKVTPETAVQVAKSLGITTIKDPEKYGLTLALGTAEVPLTQMTSAYTTFANQGKHAAPVYYTSITDKYGKNVFTYKAPKADKVYSPEATFLISSILSDNAARAPLYGSTLNFPGRSVAVKTGTTDDNVDAWTIGYTPSLTVGVWVGNNQHKPMASYLFGGSSAGLIWHDVMTTYLSGTPHENFQVPDGIVRVNICRGTDKRAATAGSNTYSEYFIRGTEPTQECNVRPATPPPTEKPATTPTPKPETPTPTPAPGNSPTPTPPPSSTTPTPTQPAGGRGGGGDEGSPTPTPTPTESPGPGGGTTNPSATRPGGGGG